MLVLAEEKAAFYDRPLGLQDAFVKFLEWGDAEKAKKIGVLEKEKEELEKEKEELLDLNQKEYAEAQKRVPENLPECASHVPRSPPELISFV